MRIVLQRVKHANVVVDGKVVAEIGTGFLLLVGFSNRDLKNEEIKLKKIVKKIPELRIFPDNNGKFDLSLKDVKGEVLAVSQFTLYGDVKKGRRPNFQEAAPYKEAEKLFDEFIKLLTIEIPGRVKKGIFGANMEINLCNDGPVTLILDSEKM